MTDEITIIDSSGLDVLLEPYRSTLGDDLVAYRNHCQRVLTYALHFLDGDQRHRPLLEAALAYHDIGLWTDDELAYLEPSEEHAITDNERLGLGHDPQALRDIIHWHHKIRPFTGPNADVVNACRKGDWIDATAGRVRKGLSKEQIAAVEREIPREGFDDVLQRMAVDLGGGALRGNLRVVRNVFKI